MSESSVSASPPGAVDPVFWGGRRVLLTGHTGFKGAWLSLWLQALGAEVTGFSGGVVSEPSLYELALFEDSTGSTAGAITPDKACLADAPSDATPSTLLTADEIQELFA